MDATENGLSFLYWISQQLLLSIQNVGKCYRTSQNYFQCYSTPKTPEMVNFKGKTKGVPSGVSLYSC